MHTEELAALILAGRITQPGSLLDEGVTSAAIKAARQIQEAVGSDLATKLRILIDKTDDNLVRVFDLEKLLR